MQTMNRSIKLIAGLLVFGVLTSISGLPVRAIEWTLPPSTALPVRFVHSVDASKARPGDLVMARTLQVIVLPSGQRLPKGTLVKGHVVDARPFRFAPAPHAEQQASRLSIHFDQIQLGDLNLPVNLSVRALANSLESEDATAPHYLDETDSLGTMVLIGKDEFSPLDKAIKDANGDVVGYNRRLGVFARLSETDDEGSNVNRKCGPTSTEQSTAIFSPSACGLYGFVDESMPHAGRSGSGTFTIESRDHSVKLYPGSTALLQETEEVQVSQQ
jgi:hypothetical protein